MDEVFARITKQELFTRTGLQLMPFNTLFQLYAHAYEGIPREAHRLLMIPDLVNLSLTGRAVTEYTNATTTQMINAHEPNLGYRTSEPARSACEAIAGNNFRRRRCWSTVPGGSRTFGLEDARC